jgi:hypothetical protein
VVFVGGGGGGVWSADAELENSTGVDTTMAAAASRPAILAEKTAARGSDMICSLVLGFDAFRVYQEESTSLFKTTMR